MEYLIWILPLLVIGALALALQRKNKELEALKAQPPAVSAPEAVQEEPSLRAQIWDYANTIHLYAALTQEESGSKSVQEKQSEILKLTEAILTLTQ